MTGTDREREQRRLRWAASQLGLQPGAPPEEARAAFLRLLPGEEFVPPPSWRWAAEVLAGAGTRSQARADEAAAFAEEQRLRGEVEAFAGDFWSVPCPDRRRRWDELCARCESFPALEARLGQLAAGLALDPLPPLAGEGQLVVELACHLRDLFPLRPADRARARQALLHGMRDRMAEWQAAARRLKKLDPIVVSLEPVLVGELLAWTKRQEAAAKAWRPREPAPQPAQPSRNIRWPVYVALVFAVAAVRGMFAVGDKDSHTPPPAPPPLPQIHLVDPPPNPPEFREPFKDMKDDDLERLRKILEKIERDRRDTGRNVFPPSPLKPDDRLP